MKDAMVYYAKCNQAINKMMTEILTKNIPDPFGLKLAGYYFKALPELLDHTFVTDMVWIKSFLDIDNYGLDLVQEVAPIPSFGDKVFSTYDEYLSMRARLDGFIVEYMMSIQDEIFAKKVVRITRSGDRIEKIVYKAMIHFFNHQTHHRGQISNILDNINIENNFSNMIFLDF